MKKIASSIFAALGFEVRRVGGAETVPLLDPYQSMRDLVSSQQPLIIDIGAHVGDTAKHFRSLFPAATIHCFEPFPSSFDKLGAAVAGDPRIHCHQLALAGESGVASMSVNQSPGTNSLLASDERAANYWGPNLLDTSGQVEVKTETLDHFLISHGIAHIDILKIDAQGAEYAILEGGRDCLGQRRADIIYMEMITAPTYVGQRRFHEYLSLLGSWGYEVFDFYNPFRAYGRLIQTDTIMVSSDFLARYERAAMASS